MFVSGVASGVVGILPYHNNEMSIKDLLACAVLNTTINKQAKMPPIREESC